MTDDRDEDRPVPLEDDDSLESVVGKKAKRRIAARAEGDRTWFWLGMLGLIGWSVSVPTLLGVALGLWLDAAVPTGFSWTLSMLFVGLAIGLLNAWFWVRQESDDRPSAVDRVSIEEEDAP